MELEKIRKKKLKKKQNRKSETKIFFKQKKKY
jgi:hypothetical protein